MLHGILFLIPRSGYHNSLTRCTSPRGYTGGSGDHSYGVYGSVVGTGTTKYAGYFLGALKHTGPITGPGSDERLKNGVVSLDSKDILSKIMQLRPTSYTYKQEGDFSSMNLPEGQRYGLIAQELEVVFPEMVYQDVYPGPVGEGEDPIGNPIEYKSVEYLTLIPLLLSAIQEQQAEIDALKSALQSSGIEVNR
ncbi:MAG: tail fiber domain-containing protein [Rhodothermales bacterium]